MAEYIEREPLLGILDGLYDHHLTMGNYSADSATQDCIEAVINAPTADVVEVRHGEWTKKRYDIDCKMYVFTCSSCLYGCVHSYKDTPIFGYCPNCGARMKGMIISGN